MSHEITWLHISDLHFQASSAWDRDIVLQALLQDLEAQVREHSLRFDFIFITGDVSFSGLKKEFDKAEQFLKRVWKLTRLRPSRTYIVPGNHDVHRPTLSHTAIALRDRLKDPSAVDAFLSAPGEVNNLVTRFRSFLKMCKSCCALPPNRFCGFARKTIQLRKVRLSVMGLNSSWVSVDDIDKGNLLIGDRQFREVLGTADNSDLRIALVHHPLEWLREFDSERVLSLLTKECDVLLRGHLHKLKLIDIRTPDGSCVQLGGGAAFEKRESQNAYNFVRFNARDRKLTVFARRFSGQFFSADTSTYQGSDDGKMVCLLPARGRLQLSRVGRATARHTRLPKPLPGPGPLVFLAFSRDDSYFLRKTRLLRSLLAPAKDEEVGFWYDQRLERSRWDPETRQRLRDSQIVVSIVSPSFMRKGFCRPVADKLKLKGQVGVAIMLKPTAWSGKGWQGRCARLPSAGTYLADVRQDKLAHYLEIGDHLKKVIRQLKEIVAKDPAVYRNPAAIYALRSVPDTLLSSQQEQILIEDSIMRAEKAVPSVHLRKKICLAARKLLRKNNEQPLSKRQLEFLDQKFISGRKRKPDAETIRWVLRSQRLHPQVKYGTGLRPKLDVGGK